MHVEMEAFWQSTGRARVTIRSNGSVILHKPVNVANKAFWDQILGATEAADAFWKYWRENGETARGTYTSC